MMRDDSKANYRPLAIRYHIKINEVIVALTVHLFDDESKIKEATKTYKFQVLMLAFSLLDSPSLSHCQDIWLPMKKYCTEDAKVYLIGTHVDCVNDTFLKSKIISHRQASHLSQTIGASAYFECSGVDLTGLSTMFTTIARSSIPIPRKKSIFEPSSSKKQNSKNNNKPKNRGSCKVQ